MPVTTLAVRIVVQETRDDSARKRTVIDTTREFPSLADALVWLTESVGQSSPDTLERVAKITLTVEGQL